MRNDMTNIILDSVFENGFMLKGLNSLRDGQASIREFRFNGADPRWFLCQWNSRHNLIGAGAVPKGGGYEISDASKRLVTDGNGGIVFRLDASREYDVPRKADEAWPHLLIEQNIGLHNRIEDLDSITLRGKFRLTALKNHMNGSERDYHTAQFVWVVVLKNTNEKSSDYQRFIWVVICLLDTRYDFAPLFCQQDKALPDGEFIYCFNGRDYMSYTLASGREAEICFDIYPRIEKILSAAKRAGFLPRTETADLTITGTNMGFEITGTFDAEVAARDLGIYVRKKSGGKYER